MSNEDREGRHGQEHDEDDDGGYVPSPGAPHADERNTQIAVAVATVVMMMALSTEPPWRDVPERWLSTET